MTPAGLFIGGIFAAAMLYVAFRMAYTLGKIQAASEFTAGEMRYLRTLIEQGNAAGPPPPRG